MKSIVYCLLPIVIFTSCRKDDLVIPPAPTDPDSMYFPPIASDTWETKSLASLNWDASAAEDLKAYLLEKNSKSFMILVNGRIVMEEYFDGHTATDTWEWNSVGKTLVATTTGIAQQELLLDIDNKVSDYLGGGWTSEPLAKENLITIKHLLTMTSGLNDSSNFVTTSNLTYLADAGTRWSYHNVFQKLMDVVAEASNQTFENYFNTRLKDKIGMDGFWNNGIIFKIYHSTTRSMARFGLSGAKQRKMGEQPYY
jgi:CubicO group peptidase (beta-lactamase class C family)